MRHREVRLVNLKQFRGSGDGASACYQALVAAPAFVDKLNGAGLIDKEFQAAFTICDSHRMVEDLGLSGSAANGVVTVPVNFAVWVNFDFTIHPAETIWQAP